MLLLILYIAIHLTGTEAVSSSNSECWHCSGGVTWANLTKEQVERFYFPGDSCIINGGSNSDCKKLFAPENCKISAQLPVSSLQYPSNFPFNLEFSYVDMAVRFNKSNSNLVLLGDSVTRWSISALFCGILQENPMASISPRIEKIIFGVAAYEITIPLANESIVLRVYSLFGITKFGEGVMNTFVRRFFLDYKQKPVTTPVLADNIVFVTNIGLHQIERYDSEMIYALKWLAALSKELEDIGTHLKIFYRESTVQHYNSTAGIFPGHMTSATICEPYNMSEATDYQDFRFLSEQEALRVLHGEVNSPLLRGLEVVYFRELSKHYYDAHPASAGAILDPHHKNWLSKATDCTHYQGYTPVLARALWGQIIFYVFGEGRTTK